MNKTYTESFQVRATDCDFERRMRLDALFIAMQEGGEHHALSLGAGYDQMMARRAVLRPGTHPCQHVPRAAAERDRCPHDMAGEMNRFFCPRYHVFTLQDGTPLAAAGALWVMLDTKQRRIVSPQKVDLGFPDNSDLTAPIALPTRMPRAERRSAAGVQPCAAVFRFRRERAREQHQIHRVAL